MIQYQIQGEELLTEGDLRQLRLDALRWRVLCELLQMHGADGEDLTPERIAFALLGETVDQEGLQPGYDRPGASGNMVSWEKYSNVQLGRLLRDILGRAA